MALQHRYRLRNNYQRQGFTLIELLVVVSIIILLAGLLLAAVMRVFVVADEARVSNDITQLNIAVENFKNRFGFYPPSKMTLGATEGASDPQAKYAIRKMFPRMNWNTAKNWGGPGSGLMNGQECLVFFLGGINGTGFSTNPVDPTDSSGDRIPPFNFAAKRLKAGPNGFMTYTDIYGNPYLYFSAYNKTNGYASSGDCGTLLTEAYYTAASPRIYANPNSFQIISAGKNGQFGNNNLGALNANALDNLTNFNRGTLASY